MEETTIEYTPIIVKKLTADTWEASCMITKPIKSEVNMTAFTEENAKRKLEIFLNNEPYSEIP